MRIGTTTVSSKSAAGADSENATQLARKTRKILIFKIVGFCLHGVNEQAGIILGKFSPCPPYSSAFNIFSYFNFPPAPANILAAVLRLTLLSLVFFTTCAFAADPVSRAGTGFVIAPDGYLLTARHLVEGAEKINVRLPDGREFPGTVVPSGTATVSCDIALVKIEASGLATLPLALGGAPQVGDTIEVIGFPSITEAVANLAASPGRVSALSVAGVPERLQVSINLLPGHSGGPVLDDKGQVIAVADHRQFLINGRFPQRLNLAIPVAQAEPLIHQALPDLQTPTPPAAPLEEKALWEKASPALVLLRVQAAPPAAELPLVVSADKYPPALARFVQDFALSGRSSSPAYAASFFAATADYFGHPGTSLADLTADLTAFRARWPERQSAVSPEGILLVADPSDPKLYHAYFDLTLSYQNGDRSHVGESAYTATISLDGPTQFHVVAVTEKVLSKFDNTAQPYVPASQKKHEK